METLAEIRHFIRGRNLLAHIGIWIIAILLLIISTTVFKNRLIGIVYLIFFLSFLLAFQTSYRLWARAIKIYCIFLIFYSTSIAAILLAYIIHPDFLDNVLSKEKLKDIGFDSTDSLAYLGCVISFIITVLTVVYLGIFHDDFHRFIYLAIEDDLSLSTPLTGSHVGVQPNTINDSTFIRLNPSNINSSDSASQQDGLQTTVLDTPPALQTITANPRSNDNKNEKQSTKYDWHRLIKNISECLWRVIESHYIKIVAFMIFRLAIVDIGLINFPFIVIIIVALSLPGVEYACCVAASWLISFIVVNRKLYHLKNLISYPLESKPNCTTPLNTLSKTWAQYVGLDELIPTPANDDGLNIESGPRVGEHLLVILFISFLSFISIHRTRRSDKEFERTFGVIFSGIGRREADKSVINGIKYLCNFGFYQFGIEITCLAFIISVCHRLDMVAAIYGIILMLISITTSQRTLARVWPLVGAIVGMSIFIQYFLILGVPQPLCLNYPWSTISEEIRHWMFLPDYNLTSNELYTKSSFLLTDFLVILAISRQSIVFQYTSPASIRTRRSLESQFREKYLPNRSQYMVEDYTNANTPIKFLKMAFFVSIYWVTLTAVLVAGATKISIFSIGYMLGCFLFLLWGNDAYRLPVPRLIFSWNVFILYSCIVILIKVFLQLVTCQYYNLLHADDKCPILQILHVDCYRKINPAAVPDNAQCQTSTFQDLDIAWDGVCLMFLLMQRVVFGSQYFKFLIMEVKAQHILASRGAELIMATQIEEAKAQRDFEIRVMEGVRAKLENLRTEGEETSKAWQRLLDLPHHHQIIRNADRHLFSTKLDDTVTDYKMDDSKYRKDYIPDPLGDELERLDEMHGISAVVTRWMKGKQVFSDDNLPISSNKSSPLSNVSPERPSSSRNSDSGANNMLIRPLESSGESQPIDDPQPGPSGTVETSEEATQSSDIVDNQEISIHETSDGFSQQPPNLLDSTLPRGPNDVELISGSENGSEQEQSKQNGILWILNNIIYSFLLTATVKLNKLSRSTRYVSRRMDAEKDVLKRSRYNLDDERFKRDQSWRKNVINSLSQNYVPTKPDRNNHNRLNMFTQFMRALGYVFVSNSSLWCQILIIINQVYSTSLLSLPLALLTFMWGTLSVPRPTKRFWKTIITITEIVIGIKYVCQFPNWKFAQTPNKDYPWNAINMLGINDGGQSSTIVVDLILLLSLFYHRSRLKSLGQWNATTEFVSSLELNVVDSNVSLSGDNRQNKRQNDDLDDEQKDKKRYTNNSTDDNNLYNSAQNILHNQSMVVAQRRPSSVAGGSTSELHYRLSSSMQLNAGSSGNAILDRSAYEEYHDATEQYSDDATNNHHDDNNDQINGTRRKRSCIVTGYHRIIRSISMFFDHVLNTPHPISTDVYTWLFICDFINFLILIYGFWAFGTGYTNENFTNFLNENKIPFTVLIMLVLQFASIMVDRYLYLKKNIKNKLFYQVFLVIAIHVWLFFVLPTITGRTLTFAQNWPPKLFYIFKCIYFLLSAYQIRCGYPRRVLGYCFTKGFGYTNLGLIKLYRAIPLLYDLRIYMDWIWTETTLEFRNWYIMEDMFSNIFIRKCELSLEEEYPTPRARPQSHISKYLYGGLFIVLILSIIWGPLLLFSMGKSVGESNPPIEFEYQLEIVGFEPLLKVRASISQISAISDAKYNQLKAGKPFNETACRSFLSDYKTSDVRVISLDTNSSSIWAISPPSRKSLIEKVANSNITLKSTFVLYREKKQKANSVDSITGYIQQIIPNWTDLVQVLNGSKSEVEVQRNIFPNFLRVPEVGSISLLQCINSESLNTNNTLKARWLKLSYDKSNGSQTDSVSWWQARNAFNDTNPLENLFYFGDQWVDMLQANSLTIITFNDRVFTGILALLSAPGIIGLYTTFVIFVARLIRYEPAGKVIYSELPNVDRVYGLVMDVYMMRESNQFELEEKLFAKLLFLYRCPELLIDWSKRDDDHEAITDR